jgi:predicted dehydrogenase
MSMPSEYKGYFFPMSNPVRLALIGSGLWAQDAITPNLLELDDEFEVVTIYSRTLENAAALAEKYPYSIETSDDLETTLQRDDIEAVNILLPIHLLPATVEKALQAGKHVLSEKPVAPTVEEGRLLLELYRDYTNQVWMVGEQWWFEDALVKAANFIQEGEIGDLILGQWAVFNSFDKGNKYFETQWRQNPQFPGGMLLDGGVHRVAAFRMLMGEIVEVNATVKQVGEVPPADTMSASFVFENGALGSFSATYAAGAWFQQPITMTGTEGTLRVERQLLETIKKGETQSHPVLAHQGVKRELQAFAAAIHQNKPFLNTPESALQDVAVVEAILESSQTQQPVQPARVVE